jgi:cytochrome c peroxidase
MSLEQRKVTIVLLAAVACAAVALTARISAKANDSALDGQLSALLSLRAFTGRVGQSLEQRLGRKIDNQLADLGRLAFHDSFLGLNDDNSCAGCHATPLGFGDSQWIAIGVENNNIVCPDRTGPRNQRRAPLVLNRQCHV